MHIDDFQNEPPQPLATVVGEGEWHTTHSSILPND